MSDLSVYFVDFVPSIARFFVEILGEAYNVEVTTDPKKAEILFFSDENFGTTNRLPEYMSHPKRVFYTGENRRFWNYPCQYAITFDHIDSENHFRLPLYVIYDWDQQKKGTWTFDSKRVLNSRDAFNREFCSFVVKNPNCFERNAVFQALSAYKTIASGGPHLNNLGYVIGNTTPEKMEFLSNYKFNLCFENGSWPGYCTEKVLEALCAGTVPIYWGSPTVEMDFGIEGIISRHDFPSWDAFLNYIQLINENTHLYDRVYTTGQIMKKTRFWDMNRFLYWFERYVKNG